MTKAIRIHHAQRIKAKRKSYYRGVHQNNARRLGALVRTAAACSCAMCGNPRRIRGEISIQECSDLEMVRLEAWPSQAR